MVSDHGLGRGHGVGVDPETVTGTNDFAFFPGKSYGPRWPEIFERCPPAGTGAKTSFSNSDFANARRDHREHIQNSIAIASDFAVATGNRNLRLKKIASDCSGSGAKKRA